MCTDNGPESPVSLPFDKCMLRESAQSDFGRQVCTDKEKLESYSLCANVLQSVFLCALIHAPRNVQRERKLAVQSPFPDI